MEFLTFRLGAPVIWATTLLATVVISAVYRIYFHPLSRFPGPTLAKVTGLSHVYHTLRRDNGYHFRHLHKKYGPVVRYAPNMLSFCTTSAVQSIYTRPKDIRKADYYLPFPRDPKDATVFSSIDKSVHEKKRRIMRHTFSNNALHSLEPAIMQHVNTLLNLFSADEPDSNDCLYPQERNYKDKDGWSGPINIADWLGPCFFDIACSACMGRSFNTLQDPKTRILATLVRKELHRANISGTLLTPLYRWNLRSWIWTDTVQDTARMVSEAKAAVLEHFENRAENLPVDLLSGLVDASDPETSTKFTDDQLWEEALSLVGGASDTSGASSCTILFYLARNPEKLQRLRDELMFMFPEGIEAGSGRALQNSKYLRAVIDEALRMYPPAPAPLHRQVEPDGTVIDGEYVPEGVDVGVPSYALHHDPELFPDPFSFVPERWLPLNDAANGHADGDDIGPLKRASTAAFIPFSTGPRNCIGKPLAYLQLSLLVASLIMRYDFRFSQRRWINGSKSGDGPEPSEHYRLEDSFNAHNDGPLLEFRARARAEH